MKREMKFHNVLLCGKQFQLKSAMCVHLKNVHNEPDQECYDCGKIFSTKANLKRHISVHNEEQRKSFNCEYCGKGYKRQSDLRVHVQKQHLPIVSETDESYEFKCDKCTKSFQDENTLIEHACFPKDNSFLNEYLVSKSTNNNKNEGIVQCEFCDKTFERNKYLKAHETIHLIGSEYPCNYCLKTFASKDRLSTHNSNYHKQSKSSLTCKICSKSYSTFFNLKKHMKIKRRGTNWLTNEVESSAEISSAEKSVIKESIIPLSFEDL